MMQVKRPKANGGTVIFVGLLVLAVVALHHGWMHNGNGAKAKTVPNQFGQNHN